MAEMQLQQVNVSTTVELKCVKNGSKISVRITSSGFLNRANCQFPRDIRKANRKFIVPATDIVLKSSKAGTYFYRVNTKVGSIVIVDDEVVDANKINKVYEDEGQKECIICMDQEHDVVIAPCGHYCLCNGCATRVKNCPLCRGVIAAIVRRDQIE
jgi:hypothetical protein